MPVDKRLGVRERHQEIKNDNIRSERHCVKIRRSDVLSTFHKRGVPGSQWFMAHFHASGATGLIMVRAGIPHAMLSHPLPTTNLKNKLRKVLGHSFSCED